MQNSPTNAQPQAPSQPVIQHSYAAPLPLEIRIDQPYYALITTNKGTIQLQLNPGEAPMAVNNFVALARRKFYDGLTFHRVVPGFVIQGGCPLGDGTGGPGYKFADERVMSDYLEGSLAMANSGPNTNGSQFFICLANQPSLPRLYTIFGKTIDGIGVVKQIRQDDLIQSIVIGEQPFPSAR